jgi:hypothetical protein
VLIPHVADGSKLKLIAKGGKHTFWGDGITVGLGAGEGAHRAPLPSVPHYSSDEIGMTLRFLIQIINIPM